MKNNARWTSSSGRPYEDTRNWQNYNEELVVRGEFLLELKWIKSWHKELKQMNSGKVGRPYEFPESLINLQAVWNQWVSVRGIEGMTRDLVKFAELPEFNDYSTIHRRVGKIKTSFQLPKQGFCSVACDGTGIKMNNAGEYCHDKYRHNKPKKWLHVVLTANPLTKDMLDLDVYIDGDGDSEPKIAMRHMENLLAQGIMIDKLWGDGSFDVKEIFNFLDRHGAESAIPPRDNASKNANGSTRRLLEVYDFQTKEWKDWAREKSYGLRWLGTEGRFSAVKTIFGEKTKSKLPKTMKLEAKRRFWAYETMRKYAQQESS